MGDPSADECSILISSEANPSFVHDRRNSNERQLATYLILASTLFERLAFYSLAINLVVTLKSSELDWNASNSTTASFIFFGTSYISSVIFAAISDAKLGRAKTIMIGFVLYILSFIAIILISNVDTHQSICKTTSTTHTSIVSEHCGPQIIGILIFMAIAVGAVQVNMTVFGAEQDSQSKFISRYFNKYYVAVNLGAILATLSIPLIQKNPNNLANSNDYFYGYTVALFMLVGAAVLFLVGYRFYAHTHVDYTVVMKLIPVTVNACWIRYVSYKEKHTISNNSLLRQDTISGAAVAINDEPSLSFLDYAKRDNRGKFSNQEVNEVRSLSRCVSVLLLLIPYWIIYYQTQITFPLQGQQMSIPYFANGQRMPISWMSLGDSITIIISIIIMSTFAPNYWDDQNKTVKIRTKLIIGMGLASAAMFIAGLFEIIRQRNCSPGLDKSNLSIFFQLPQNICMGLSEVFGTITSLEFTYLFAPHSARSFLMSLQFCSLGLSSFIGKGYLSIYSTTSSTFDFSCLSLNSWVFATYFFILSALQFGFIVIFMLCYRNFQSFNKNS